MPEASALGSMRRSIVGKPHVLKQVLLDARLRKEFLGGASSNEKAVVEAFAAQNQGNALKTKPKVRNILSY